MRKRTIRAGSAAVVAALLLGGAARAEEFAVAPRPIEDLKAVFGTVESVKTAPARARIGGTLADLAIVEGERIEAGRKLARVNDPKLALQISALDAKVRSLEAQRELADTELKRARELRATGAATQARLDAAETALDVVRGQLAAAVAERAVVVQQQAEGDVIAPVSGRVLKVKAVNGTVVMPGETIVEIATDTYVLRITVPERHARFMRAGGRVLVGERGLAEDQPLREGRIRLVYPEMRDGRVVADAEVSGLGDYFVGERTRVFVAAGTRPAIVIPPAYVIRRFGLAFVRLKSGGDVVVQPGAPAEGGVEILSGLRAGDVLVRP
ncbi:MAG: efflux RND transporter periplasmic adaptor subunit [Candidatus Odyssella sp.]|nr:efflux RND transporter periplasmic adaptor subunit [Candidatus Odyssella sp.]